MGHRDTRSTFPKFIRTKTPLGGEGEEREDEGLEETLGKLPSLLSVSVCAVLHRLWFDFGIKNGLTDILL